MVFAPSSNTEGLDSREIEQINMVVAVLNAKSHYQVLGLDKEADEGAIKTAHRKLALRLHPDKVRFSSDRDRQKAERAFRAVQMAYEILSKPHSRKMYDLEQRMASSSTKFVPGESGGDVPAGEDEDGPSIAGFFSAMLQILPAVLLYVCLQVYADCRAPFSAQARALHAAVAAFLALWKLPALQLGLWTSLAYASSGYSVHRLVPPQYWWVLWEVQTFKATQADLTYALLFAEWAAATQWIFRGAGPASGLVAGIMSGCTVLMGLLMPQMSFGAHARNVGYAVAFGSVVYLSFDMHLATFIGLSAWHLLQAVPAVCIAVLAMVLLYVLWKLSVVLILGILSVAFSVLASDSILVTLTAVLGTLISLWAHAWQSTALYIVASWGLRATFHGWWGGKRAVLSAVLAWCLDYGVLLEGTLIAAVFIGGEFLLAVIRSEAEMEHPRGAHSHAGGASGSPPQPGGTTPPGQAPHSNKKKKGKAGKH